MAKSGFRNVARACAAKARFSSAEEAHRHCNFAYRAYACPVCGQWHLSSRGEAPPKPAEAPEESGYRPFRDLRERLSAPAPLPASPEPEPEPLPEPVSEPPPDPRPLATIVSGPDRSGRWRATDGVNLFRLRKTALPVTVGTRVRYDADTSVIDAIET